MADREDDSVLLSRARDRDRDAFARLYDRYSRLVYSIALRVVSNSGTAEDILHEVFLQLWQSPQQFDAARGSLPSWLSVIARNRAIDHLRRQRTTIAPEDVALCAGGNIASDVELAQFIGKVRQLLAAMPDGQRRALEMAFFEGKTHSEIASECGEPLGTIKTRIRAALTAIRKALHP